MSSYYSTLNSIKKKPKLIYRDQGPGRCSCGFGNTVYSIYQTDKNTYKKQIKYEKCLSFESSDDDEEIDGEKEYSYILTSDEYINELNNAMDTIIERKHSKNKAKN